MNRKYDVRIIATFNGRAPSMGFYPGLEYKGWVRGNTFFEDSGLSCPYSVSGFLTFWTEIDILQCNKEETRLH